MQDISHIKRAKISFTLRRKREITNTDFRFSLPIIIIIIIIIRTVHDVKFNLSDQPYLHLNVNTIDTQSPTRFGTS